MHRIIDSVSILLLNNKDICLQELPKKNDIDNNELNKTHVVSLFSLVAMYLLSAMGVLALFNQNFVLAGTLFFSSILCYSGYFVYRKFKNTSLSSALVLYSLYALMFYLIYTGGVEQTGPLWIFIVAPLSVFIHGLKRGLVDITFFVVIMSLIMFMPIESVNHAQYSTEFKLRLIYSFLTVTALSSLYEYSRNKSYKHALELSDKYQQLAHFDTLTQLSNRRDALHIFKREQARAIRNNQPLSIILCDVDHFKKINDQFGHNAGDEVLKALAKLFTDNMRDQDCVARWGGEEFLFILPNTDFKNAYVFADKIKNKIQRHIINYEDKNISMTISMGVEQFKSTQTIDEVINTADKYLYQAKDAGRNQIFPKSELNDV